MARRNSQTFTTGLSSGETGGSLQQAHVVGQHQHARGVPTSLIRHEQPMGARSNGLADLGQMAVHCVNVRFRQDKCRAYAPARAVRPNSQAEV
ncbi:hypothetical protein GCM10011320_51630 [Neoroseomonas lacus]|uniref:Uncharacterized protein n=1 Tax=Neoroseomonas lacus TaxID=287609 RepID=A0A917KZK7_9PROT|nr:hypothetical protein GCM10011320_51630 [Neoroseomonas lacus]